MTGWMRLTAASTLALMLPGLAAAQGLSVDRGMARLDTDGDGRISQAEFTVPVAAAFDRLDADDDGKLTQEEVSKARRRGAADFATLDTDGDGALSAEEFKAGAAARFVAADADGDGFVTGAEARALRRGAQAEGAPGVFKASDRGYGDYRQGWHRGHGRGDRDCMGPQHMGRGEMRGDMQGRGMMGPMGHMGQMGPRGQMGQMGPGGFLGAPGLSEEDRQARAERLVEWLDADGDGLLSVEEMTTRPGPERLFDRADADGDGSISKEEFDAAVERFGTLADPMRNVPPSDR